MAGQSKAVVGPGVCDILRVWFDAKAHQAATVGAGVHAREHYEHERRRAVRLQPCLARAARGGGEGAGINADVTDRRCYVNASF